MCPHVRPSSDDDKESILFADGHRNRWEGRRGAPNEKHMRGNATRLGERARADAVYASCHPSSNPLFRASPPNLRICHLSSPSLFCGVTNRNGLFSLLPPSLGSGNETAEKEIGQQVFGERLTGGVTAKNRLGSATVNFTRKEQREEDLSRGRIRYLHLS